MAIHKTIDKLVREFARRIRAWFEQWLRLRTLRSRYLIAIFDEYERTRIGERLSYQAPQCTTRCFEHSTPCTVHDADPVARREARVE